MTDKEREIAEKYSHLCGSSAAYYSARDALGSCADALAAKVSEIEQLQARVKELESAECRFCGGTQLINHPGG